MYYIIKNQFFQYIKRYIQLYNILDKTHNSQTNNY